MRSRKIFFHLLSIALFTSLAAAQFTLVSGTVTDPNGTPYALGTISAQVVTAGVTPRVNGSAFTMSVGPANLSTAGSFTLNLVSSTAMAPNLPWLFTVCSGAGTIQPAGGTGPVCFTSSITITGATQSISATLSAAAPALSNGSGAAGTLKAAVTIPAAGTTFTPATGTVAKFIGGTTTFDILDSLGGGLYIDDPANFAGAVVLQADGSPGNEPDFFATTTGAGIDGTPTGGGLFFGSASSCLGAELLSPVTNTSVQLDCAGGNLGVLLTDDAGDSAGLAAGAFTSSVKIAAPAYATSTICAAVGTSAATSIASCATAAAGAFSCAVAASGGTCRVNSTAVTANSSVFIQPTASSPGLTCNAVADTGLTAPRLLSVNVAGNFFINLGTFTTTAECFKYWVVN